MPGLLICFKLVYWLFQEEEEEVLHEIPLLLLEIRTGRNAGIGFRQTGENNDLNTLINNWADHPGRGPQALHPDGGVLGEEVPRILLRQRLHPQRQRQQGVENDLGAVNPTS